MLSGFHIRANRTFSKSIRFLILIDFIYTTYKIHENTLKHAIFLNFDCFSQAMQICIAAMHRNYPVDGVSYSILLYQNTACNHNSSLHCTQCEERAGLKCNKAPCVSGARGLIIIIHLNQDQFCAETKADMLVTSSIPTVAPASCRPMVLS